MRFNFSVIFKIPDWFGFSPIIERAIPALMRSLIFFLLLTLISVSGYSTSIDNNQNCQTAYLKILCLQFEEAQMMIDAEQKNHPDNLYLIYLQDYKNFLTLLFTENEQQYIQQYEDFNLKVDRIHEFTQDSSANFILSEMYIKKAILQAKFGNLWEAGYSFFKSYSYLNESISTHPNFTFNSKILGLFHLVLGSIPEEYKLITEIIGLKGNVNSGMHYLNRYYRSTVSNEAYHLEAILLKSLALHYFDKDQEASFAFIEKFAPSYPDNQIFGFVYSLCALKGGRNDDAIHLLEGIKPPEKTFCLTQNDYLLGQCKLFKLDSSANVPLEKFLSEFKGSNYKKSTSLKLAWHYLIHGDTIASQKYSEKFTRVGAANYGADKQALNEVGNYTINNVILLKARLLYDGGYYQRAETLLNTVKDNGNQFEERDKIEFIYRKARVDDKLGKTTEAEKKYKWIIGNCPDPEYYFAPNSALKLGEMYERNNDPIRAEKWYTECLDMNHSIYKNSIEFQAKAGLSRIRNK